MVYSHNMDIPAVPDLGREISLPVRESGRGRIRKRRSPNRSEEFVDDDDIIDRVRSITEPI